MFIFEICYFRNFFWKKKKKIVLDQRHMFLRTEEQRLMIHKGHFGLVNQKDMRSNAQNKTENMSS
jgi:G:T/U-mismatch repair DNA glycosylase